MNLLECAFHKLNGIFQHRVRYSYRHGVYFMATQRSVIFVVDDHNVFFYEYSRKCDVYLSGGNIWRAAVEKYHHRSLTLRFMTGCRKFQMHRNLPLNNLDIRKFEP